MKNKSKIINLVIIILILFNTASLSNDDFIFNVTELEILDNGNKLKGLKGGTVTTNDGIIFEADEFIYDKVLNILNANGNIKIEQKTHTQMDSYTIMNAFARYTTADEKMSITLFGKNLTEKVYRVDAAAVAGLWNWSNFGEPRLIGMKVDYNF